MLSAGDFIRSLVEAKPPGHPANVIEIIGTKLDVLTKGILTGTKFAREAMTDLLKFTFNLLLHYPKVSAPIAVVRLYLLTRSHQLVDETSNKNETKVMGDCWSDRLDGCVDFVPVLFHAHILMSPCSILPYLLRTFTTLPPSFPAPLAAPLTHVIHSLITIPVSPSLRNVWFPPSSTTNNRGSPVPTSKPSSSSDSSSKASRSNSSSSSSQAGSPTSGPSKDPKPGAFDRAWSALSAGRRSLSRSSSPHASSAPIDVLLRSYDLLDVSLNHYMPGTVEADDPGVRERCRGETDQTLDDVMTPLAVLITKLCQADEGARMRMRAWILPEDLDRTSPLEGRADLLGRLLRLLQSVHHAKLKNAVGEMLFAVCDSDGAFLSALRFLGAVLMGIGRI